jgi:hypothetical protein
VVGFFAVGFFAVGFFAVGFFAVSFFVVGFFAVIEFKNCSTSKEIESFGFVSTTSCLFLFPEKILIKFWLFE